MASRFVRVSFAQCAVVAVGCVSEPPGPGRGGSAGSLPGAVEQWLR